jgi:Z1 domain
MRGVAMQYLKTYLRKITDRGNVKLAESIAKTAEDIGNQHIRNFSFASHEIGLLFGNVQSGKTGQMFGIMCKASDLGFPAFVLLTTDNVVLQQQTLERVRRDLDGFCVCGENDSGLFIENSLVKPVIVVLKKNARVLRLWANVFNSTGFMKGNPLFIVDDEADAASLNTLVNRNGQSSINKYLDSIKNGSSSSLYLQVTATPQAILLQTLASGWHPYFSYYFRPGDGYLGGDFFFPNTGKPECIDYLETIKRPTRNVVIRHLAVSAQILATGGKVSNCLLHPSVRQAVHQRFADDVIKELCWCVEHINDDFISEFQVQYASLAPEKSEKLPFNDIYKITKELLKNKGIKILVMNGKTDVESSEYERGCNFIIGGNTLGRGVTFPGLQTIYYTRTSKNPQADTMWQHSRMFGYDRDPGMMKIFIDEQLYKLFSDINATNNSIIAQIEQGIDSIKIYYPNGINPTRKNVLDNKHVGVISGGTNYYPFYPDNDSIEGISRLLDPFSDDEQYYQVNLRFIKEILSHIIPSPDFKLNVFLSVIDTILSEQPAGQGILIVRRERNVAQGTGALLSPNDWKLGGAFLNKVVLTMYQVTGTKGWGGKALWVPNIKLPHDIMYYDVVEDNTEA